MDKIFKEFHTAKLFDIHPTKAYKLSNASLYKTVGNTPVLSNSSMDNGIGGYSSLSATEQGNIITFSDTTTGTDTIFYQPDPFIGYAHVQGLYPYDKKNWNEKECLYFIGVLKITCGKGWNYANKFTRKFVLNTNPLLPIEQDENGKPIIDKTCFYHKKGYIPDFEYMHNYISELEKERISELEKERISELEKYLLVSGLNDYQLSDEEQMLISKDVNLEKYRIDQLFIVEPNPQLNKDSFEFSPNGDYPYFTRTVLNNGIAGYVNYLDEEHKIKGNSIAVGMLGMKFFYMKKDFYAGQFTKTIYPKFKEFDEEVALYFTVLFNKKSEIFKSVLVRDFEKTFLNDTIELPVKDGNIDFEYIKKFIKIQQKLAIKDVIDYKESIINKTKEVVG